MIAMMMGRSVSFDIESNRKRVGNVSLLVFFIKVFFDLQVSREP